MNKQRMTKVIVWSIGIFVFSIVYYLINKFFHIGLLCPWNVMFHVNCPGCGISRMFFAIIELNYYQAFRYNPLMFIYLPFAIVLAIDMIIAYVKDRRTIIFRRIPLFVWIFVMVITIGFGVIRNLPPFEYLSPTEVGQKVEK